MNTNGFIFTSAFLVSGLVVGHLSRRLLARLRRGAVFRPPGCELFAAMASAIVGWRFAVGALPAWWCAVPLLLGWLAVPLAAVDLSACRLPNALTYAAYPILGTALAVAAACGPDHSLAVRALLGTAVFGGAHALVRWFAPAALGAGDVKLAGSLGAVLGALGWQSLLLATALAATITLLLALTPRAQATPIPTTRPPTSQAQATSTPTPLPLSAEATPTPAPRPITPPKEHPPTHLHSSTPPQPTRNPLPPIPTLSTSPTSNPPPLAKALAPTPEPVLMAHARISLTQPEEAPPTPKPPLPLESAPTQPTEALFTPSAESRSPTPTSISDQVRIPLLRRVVPHGPGLLIATWLLATFPGQALIGGVTS